MIHLSRTSAPARSGPTGEPGGLGVCTHLVTAGALKRMAAKSILDATAGLVSPSVPVVERDSPLRAASTAAVLDLPYDVRRRLGMDVVLVRARP